MTRTRDAWLTRRRLLKNAAGVIGAASVPGIRGSSAPSLTDAHGAGPALNVQTAALQAHRSDVTARLARYMVQARELTLPPAVIRDAKQRVLDTIGAIVSGARLKPGEMAIRSARGRHARSVGPHDQPRAFSWWRTARSWIRPRREVGSWR